jgi:hypothetical protein
MPVDKVRSWSAPTRAWRQPGYAVSQSQKKAGSNMAGNAKGAHKAFRLIHLLLIIPFVAVLWTPFYNSSEPSLAGVPFFYWYQMLWIVLGAAILYPIYRVELRDGD